MVIRYLLTILSVALLWTSPARADGTIYRVAGCGDYIFVAAAADTFSMLTASGLAGVKEGDELIGNVERVGQTSLYDRTAGRTLFAAVVDRRLNQPEVRRRIAIRCRAPLAERIVSGYVLQAANCGNKIFVNTPEGYAVMERIAGGVVAEGDTLTGPYNKPGRATVTDQQTNSTLVVFVEDLWLSKSATERKITVSCRRQR